MDLKNNITEQKEYLERNLDQLNMVVSAVLGIRTHLRIEEKTNYRKETYFRVIDDRNIRDCCGVMAKAFAKVTIEDFGVWWQENGVRINLDFCYTHIDGGSNGAHFCTVEIIDNFVTII